MPTSLGPAEILVILVVALIVLGPKRLPEAGRQVGKAISEVRKWSHGFQEEIRSTIDPKPSRPTYPAPAAGAEPSPIPMVPADTDSPADVDASSPTAATNGSSDVPGVSGMKYGPSPAAAEPADPAPTDPFGPPAGEPPRT